MPQSYHYLLQPPSLNLEVGRADSGHVGNTGREKRVSTDDEKYEVTTIIIFDVVRKFMYFMLHYYYSMHDDPIKILNNE